MTAAVRERSLPARQRRPRPRGVGATGRSRALAGPPPAREPCGTLAGAIGSVWSQLQATGAAPCPVCAGRMSAGSGGGQGGPGVCGRCGTTLC